MQMYGIWIDGNLVAMDESCSIFGCAKLAALYLSSHDFSFFEEASIMKYDTEVFPLAPELIGRWSMADGWIEIVNDPAEELEELLDPDEEPIYI